MYSSLENCNLFRDLKAGQIENLLAQVTFQVKKYSKGDVVVLSGTKLEGLKIVAEGSVKGEMTDFSGKVIKIEDIESPRCLAPAFLFGNNNWYPVDILANNKVTIISIPQHDFIKLLSASEVILRNYLDIVSNKAQFLSSRLKFLSFQSIKGKLAHYLLTFPNKSHDDKLVLDKTQSELAELFGVTRPSLSRALRELDSEGLIEAEGRNISIIDRKGLTSLLR